MRPIEVTASGQTFPQYLARAKNVATNLRHVDYNAAQAYMDGVWRRFKTETTIQRAYE